MYFNKMKLNKMSCYFIIKYQMDKEMHDQIYAKCGVMSTVKICMGFHPLYKILMCGVLTSGILRQYIAYNNS